MRSAWWRRGTSESDIFSNLQCGAMGLVVARKGNWGLGADAIWMALGTTVRDQFGWDILTRGPVGGIAFRF
jgi:hypothetical protein